MRRVRQIGTPETPLTATFGLFAERLELRTNAPAVLDAAAVSFGRFEVPADERPPLVLRVHVAGGGRPARPDAGDLVHDTAGHLLTIGLDAGNRAGVDVARGFGTATITPELAADAQLLRWAFLEAMPLAMLTGGRGYLPIHASCVVRDGVGLLLQGPAGAGKSTIAYAAARRGWGLLAEDVVFARRDDGRPGHEALELWGMPWTQRLLPDASGFFPELAGLPARLQVNGERKLEVDLDAVLPGVATPRASAGPIVLLARDGGPVRAAWAAPGDDSVEVEVLWPWESGWTDAHDATADALLRGGVLRLWLDGSPEAAVDALEAALAAGPGSGPAPAATDPVGTATGT